jgi:hypothetical protein
MSKEMFGMFIIFFYFFLWISFPIPELDPDVGKSQDPDLPVSINLDPQHGSHVTLILLVNKFQHHHNHMPILTRYPVIKIIFGVRQTPGSGSQKTHIYQRYF